MIFRVNYPRDRAIHTSGAITAEQLRPKVARRLLPFLSLLYVIAYLDRANIAFARVPMARDLHFSDAVYGLGAGMFFLGYFFLEIPGALIVERWGARRWIARIMVTWGLITISFAFIRTPAQFYASRLFLGIAEAGFFPGVIVYLTHWFRCSDRSRALAAFAIGAPIALVFGGPVSALMLQINWMAVGSWRWLFILQGLAAVVFGIVAFFYLTDSPRNAKWLDPRGRELIEEALSREKKSLPPPERWWQALRRGNVLVLCAAHVFLNIAGYGYIFWLPSTIKSSMAITAVRADVFSTLPFALAVLAMWVAGRSCDRTGKPKFHAYLPMLCAALFFALSTFPSQSSIMRFVWLSLTGASVFAWIPGFWTLPTSISLGPARAASVGLINSFGNLGGFLGPVIIGRLQMKSASGHGLVALVSVSYCAAAILVAVVKMNPKHG